MNIELAKRLKAAGFPQGEPYAGNPALWFSTKEVMAYTDQGKWLLISYWALTSSQCYCFEEQDIPDFYAAPSSDELLAAIQARWPDAGQWWHLVDDAFAVVAPPVGGVTLLDALAELYIKLAGENPDA